VDIQFGKLRADSCKQTENTKEDIEHLQEFYKSLLNTLLLARWEKTLSNNF
jgi:hypothetical protein